MKTRTAILLLAASLLLAACGNKGPLVLPSREAPDPVQDDADAFDVDDVDDGDAGAGDDGDDAEGDPAGRAAAD